MKLRALNLIIALDILLLVLITLGGSKRNETISSAAWSLELSGKWQGRLFRPMIDWLLSWLEKDHCLGAYITAKKPLE